MTDTTDESNPNNFATRRRFLGATATGALAGVGYAVASGRGRAQSARTIELGGEIVGWQGRAPEEIAGETNPTLELDTGRKYRITWENVDGFGHNIALLDGNGTVVERTTVLAEQGETQTIAFTAHEELAEYICEPHSGSMRGTISFGSAPKTTTETPETEDSPVPRGPTIELETIADGFQVPTDFAVPPNSTRRFILDLPGQVYVHDGDGLDTEVFIDVSDRLSEISGERGLLGIAFHPEFETNRKFYLRYSAPLAEDAPDEYSHTEVLAEFLASEDGKTGIPDSERVLLEVHEPREVHNGGAVTFGPDGYLYLSLGDGGGPRDTGVGHAADWYERNEGGNGQNVTENLLGSVLRIDIDSREDDKPYGIPDDNPLVGKPGLDEQYAWGFRNPWRMGFSNGELFVADVGQNRYEEVNHVVKGGNYGWNVKEGTHCYGTESPTDFPANCPDSTPSDVRGGEALRDPVIEYPHSKNGQLVGISVIGGYIYEGSIDALSGRYVFGDYSRDGSPRGSLFAATPTEDGLWPFVELDIADAESGAVEGYLIAIGRERTGELYALTSGGELGGAVHRLAPSVSETQTTVPTDRTRTDTVETTTQATTTKTTETTTQTTEPTGPTGTPEATETRAVRTAQTSDIPEVDSTPPKSAGTNGTETSSTNGPGFGVLAALVGLASISARRLRWR